VTDPRNQSKYQVRFDWGIEGAAAITPGAHVVVWADALPGGGIDPLVIAHDGAIITGSTGSRTAVAEWILAGARALGIRDRAGARCRGCCGSARSQQFGRVRHREGIRRHRPGLQPA